MAYPVGLMALNNNHQKGKSRQLCSMPKSSPIIIISFFCLVTAHAQSWQPTPTQPQGTCSDLKYWQNQLLVSTYGGFIYSSTNEGQSWQPLPLPGNPRPIYGLYQSRNRWFAGCAEGMYESTNQGQSWRWINIPTPYVVTGVAVLGSGHLVVATADIVGGGPTASGVIRSTNHGNSWESVNANLPSSSISKMLHTSYDFLVVALNHSNETSALFSTVLGPQGTYRWIERPIRIFNNTDSSRAYFKSTDWFDLQWYGDSSILISAAGIVQEPGATNGVFVQWVGIKKNSFISLQDESWVETISFGPQYNQWWDQPAPANILRLQEKNHWYGSLQGGNARGGAWVLSDSTQGWQKRNIGIPAGPNGWEVMQFAEGPFGRVFAIHQGFQGVYFNDFSRRWATASPHLVVEKLRLWPNPGDGLVQLDLAFDVVKLQVLDAKGQQVWRQDKLMMGIQHIDLRTLAAGMYVIRAFSQSGMYQTKYVKGG